MLYDPKWEHQTKADPLSIAGLISWLETQPANGGYDWMYVQNCLACHYLKAIGLYAMANPNGPRYIDIDLRRRT